MNKTVLNTRYLTNTALFTAIICACSFITIPLPFTPVPITLQVLAVFLASLYLPRKQALFSIFIYLMLGLIGLPVFSGFKSGIGTLLGPTGGFLLSFIPASFLISILKEKTNVIFASFCGLAMIYLFGVLQFCFITNRTFVESFSVTILPFLFPDILKIIGAVSLNRTLKIVTNNKDFIKKG